MFCGKRVVLTFVKWSYASYRLVHNSTACMQQSETNRQQASVSSVEQRTVLTATDAVAQSDVDPAGQLLTDEPQR